MIKDLSDYKLTHINEILNSIKGLIIEDVERDGLSYEDLRDQI